VPGLIDGDEILSINSQPKNRLSLFSSTPLTLEFPAHATLAIMFSQDRSQLRQLFFDAWRKQGDRQPLEPLEQLIVHIIEQHPEYHALLENPATNLERDYLPETGQTNPFLHMAMHISIQEQLGTRRPAGIERLYAGLVQQQGDPHAAEHLMMECLAEMLWQSQRQGTPPDEAAYLACLRKQIGVTDGH